MKADLEYINTGLFTHFMPNTKAGEAAWNEMAKDDGCAAVLSIYAKNVISQLRNVGYSVAKAKPVKISDDELLTALGV